ncbi:phosphonate metabolism transcriptional regulator PhnF [Neobacillus sp. Marseille-QA0830]
MVNKNSPIPLYYQLQEHIKELVDGGKLKPGDSLPPEREYAEKYQISRMTVRQAITELVNMGYLYRVQGKGTFVAERKIEQPLHGLTSFTEDMKARGLEPSSHLLQFDTIAAPSQVAGELSIPVLSTVYEIRRIRLADGTPMAMETNYLPAALIKGLTESIATQSLYAYIENQLNLKIDHASQIIESSLASQNEAKFLHISKDAPIMLIKRVTYLTDGTPVEYVESVYRADRYKFMIHMNR